MNPLLWICTLAPAAWLFAFLLRSDVVLEYGFAILGGLPILCSLVSYFVLPIVDRDRLQSEEFILRQQELAIIERKAGPPLALGSDVSNDQPRLAKAGRDPDEAP